MRRMTLAGVCALAILCLALPVGAVVSPVTSDEALNWIRYTTPLPKSIKITGKTEVAAGRVQIIPSDQNDIVAEQTVKELSEAVGLKEGASAVEPEFTIRLQVGGPESETLKRLKNSDQAYRIFASSDRELSLVGLSSRGVYYAAKTLQQLINARKKDSRLTMPILEVTDWPDMQKRGLWGSDNFNHLKWLADRKMNLMEQISWSGIGEDKKPYAKIKEQREPLIYEGPKYGIEFSPVILHLEQSSRPVIEAFPHLKGKAEHPGVFCYSQPQVAEIIAEWMVQLASLPNVTSLDTWMTENLSNKPGCQCEKCKDQKWPVLEARTIVNAWKMAQEKLGRPFKLRVMTAESTEFCNYEVFRELPPDVELAYYHSLLTYNAMRRPMLRGYLAAEAKRRWVGVVPNVSPTVGFCVPMTGAEFIHYRMNEFVDKGLSGLLGYSTPRVHYYRFNVEAAAEWTWNAKGRDTREFAYSYAVRQGYKDPEKFAEWSETMGPVAFDVYASGFPNEELRAAVEPVAIRLKKGTLPDLGYVLWDAFPQPFGGIPNEERLKADVRAAAKGVRLAKEMGIPGILQESLVVDGFIRAIDALWELKKLSPRGQILPENKMRAYGLYQRYVDGLTQAKKALPKWEDTVITDFEPGKFTDLPVKTIDKMLEQMKQTAVEMGFDRP